MRPLREIPARSVSAIIVLLFVGLTLVACGPSYEEKQAKQEAKRQELARQRETRYKNLIEQISQKYSAVAFPPEGVKPNVFTYELQRSLTSNGDKPILFSAYLDDVEKTGPSIVAEFLCPVGREFYEYQTAVRFRLDIDAKEYEQLLAQRTKDPEPPEMRRLTDPEYLVVAKVDGLRRSRLYEVSGYTHGDEEVEMNISVPTRFISHGKLVEAILIPGD